MTDKAPTREEVELEWAYETIKRRDEEIERLKALAKEEVAGLSFYKELLSEHRRALKVVEAAKYQADAHHPTNCSCGLCKALAELEGGNHDRQSADARRG
jgi:hypothetical protein